MATPGVTFTLAPPADIYLRRGETTTFKVILTPSVPVRAIFLWWHLLYFVNHTGDRPVWAGFTTTELLWPTFPLTATAYVGCQDDAKSGEFQVAPWVYCFPGGWSWLGQPVTVHVA